jgi:general secretion pathway protein L
MLKLDTRIDLDLDKFLRWWGGELAFLVPARLRKLLGAGRARLVLTRGDAGLGAALWSGEGVRSLGQWKPEEASPGLREQLFAAEPELDEAELILRLGPGQSLTRAFKLPAVAEENLQQVAAFEMDRLTPFKAEQVYFDVRVLERLADTKQIRVELVLTPRHKLDLILDELAAQGFRPDRVDVDSAAAGPDLDLLPDKFRAPKSQLPKRLTLAAAALLFFLAAAVLVLPIVKNKSLMETLQHEVKTASKVAQEVQSLREDAEKLANENGFLAQRKRQEPAMVDMLEELSKVIPDQTSLNGLQYRDRKVIIQGQSPAASALIELMEASPYFKNTSFVSPVTKDISNGQERFQIASEVVNGRSSEKPAE